MVMARLHIICGNCGNGDKDMFENETNNEHEVLICCKNCSTVHYLITRRSE